MKAALQTLLLVIACATTASKDARADMEDETFQRWAKGISDGRHQPICAWGSLAHPESKLPGRFAWFNDASRAHVHRVVFESAGKRWLLRTDERAAWGGTELACPATTLEWAKHTQLTFPYTDQSNISELEEVVTIVDGDVVELEEEGRGYHDHPHTDWVAGTYSWTDPHPYPENEGDPEDVRGMLIALPEGSRWWPKVPRLPAEVTYGSKSWTGKADADLSVRAVMIPDAIRIEMSATDDRAVLVPADADARAIVRADHFELWFCTTGHGAPDCDKPLAQLAVGRAAAGGALARWLSPSTAPPPAVSVEKDRVVVVLPRALIGARPTAEGGPILVPLTLAYSDSDDPARGQQTMVATAAIKKAQPVWPSLLSVADADRPFPRWHRVKPLAPGEDIFAEDPACGDRAISRARAEAARPLKTGAFADAVARLDSLAARMRDRCGGYLSSDARAGIYNDLALARHKAGDDAGWLRALGDVLDPLSPATARATTFNRALCGGPCKEEAPGCREGKAARSAPPRP